MKKVKLLCIASINMGKATMAQLVVPGSNETIYIPHDNATEENKFEPQKFYIASFEEAPIEAAPAEEAKTEMEATK